MQQEENKFYDPEYDNKEGFGKSIVSAVCSAIGVGMSLLSLISALSHMWYLPVSGAVLGIVGIIISKISDKGCGLKHKQFVTIGKVLGITAILAGFIFAILSLGAMK